MFVTRWVLAELCWRFKPAHSRGLRFR